MFKKTFFSTISIEVSETFKKDIACMNKGKIIIPHILCLVVVVKDQIVTWFSVCCGNISGQG